MIPKKHCFVMQATHSWKSLKKTCPGPRLPKGRGEGSYLKPPRAGALWGQEAGVERTGKLPAGAGVC